MISLKRSMSSAGLNLNCCWPKFWGLVVAESGDTNGRGLDGGLDDEGLDDVAISTFEFEVVN